MNHARLKPAPQSTLRPSQPRLGDLAWALAGAALLLGLIVLGEYAPSWAVFVSPLRLVLGIGYVLYVPGYLLQAAMFAYREDLDAVERHGLSLGLSVALIPLVALLLDWLPWGLRFWPIVFSQVLLIELLVFLALARRLFMPVSEAFAPDIRPRPRRWWRKLDPLDRWLFLFSFGILLFAGLTAAWIVLVPSGAEFLTEFYMLGPEDLAENFPRQAAVGEMLDVTLGVTNHERQSQTYRVEIWQVDAWSEPRRALVGKAELFTLQVGERREWNQPWQPAWEGKDQQFEILLYTLDDVEAYRRLLLWVDVER
jgi:uncharacterized membrane protein